MRIKEIPVIFVFAFLFLGQILFAQAGVDLKSEIYSKLKCCNCQVVFQACTCLEAEEMKAYIEALLGSGIKKEDVYFEIAKKYTIDTIIDPKIKQAVKKRLISAAGSQRSQIVLQPATFNFGKVNKRQGKISRVFELSNTGNVSLIIKRIRTSCPCATVSLRVNNNVSGSFGTQGSPDNWQMEISPSASGKLELMVDLASSHVKTGKLIRDALITSNDPLYPETTVSIEAEVSD